MEHLILRAAREARRAPLPPASRAAQLAEWLAPFSAVAREVPGNRRTALAAHGGLLRGPDGPLIAGERYAAIKAGPVNASVIAVLLKPALHDPRFFLAHGAGFDRGDRSLAALRRRAELEVGLDALDTLLPRWRALAEQAGGSWP